MMRFYCIFLVVGVLSLSGCATEGHKYNWGNSGQLRIGSKSESVAALLGRPAAIEVRSDKSEEWTYLYSKDVPKGWQLFLSIITLGGISLDGVEKVPAERHSLTLILENGVVTACSYSDFSRGKNRNAVWNGTCPKGEDDASQLSSPESGATKKSRAGYKRAKVCSGARDIEIPESGVVSGKVRDDCLSGLFGLRFKNRPVNAEGTGGKIFACAWRDGRCVGWAWADGDLEGDFSDFQGYRYIGDSGMVKVKFSR